MAASQCFVKHTRFMAVGTTFKNVVMHVSHVHDL